MKNIHKLMIMLAIIYVWLPTGPSALFITTYLVKTIGWEAYLVMSGFMVWALYVNMRGKTLIQKLRNTKNEVLAYIK